jgi:hypothetical protein
MGIPACIKSHPALYAKWLGECMQTDTVDEIR